MTALVIASAVGVSTGLFALWCWVMDRLEAREERREAERLRRREAPVLGEAPRHLHSKGRCR